MVCCIDLFVSLVSSVPIFCLIQLTSPHFGHSPTAARVLMCSLNSLLILWPRRTFWPLLLALTHHIARPPNHLSVISSSFVFPSSVAELTRCITLLWQRLRPIISSLKFSGDRFGPLAHTHHSPPWFEPAVRRRKAQSPCSTSLALARLRWLEPLSTDSMLLGFLTSSLTHSSPYQRIRRCKP
jgi:hypothetical protein